MGRVTYGEEAGDGVRRRLDAKMNLGTDGELAPTGVVDRVGRRDVDGIGNGEWRQGLCELARGMGALPGS